jgi:hypothetical protein
VEAHEAIMEAHHSAVEAHQVIMETHHSAVVSP